MSSATHQRRSFPGNQLPYRPYSFALRQTSAWPQGRELSFYRSPDGAYLPTRRDFGLGIRGLGDAKKHQLITGSVTQGLAAASSIALMVGGPLGPMVAGILGIAAGVSTLFNNVFNGCGDTCVAATRIVDQLEPYLQANLDNYFSLRAPRTYSQQALALQLFDEIWARVQEGCSNPALGVAGQRCTSDRRSGACTWKNDGHGGEAGSGDVCWNWFVGYRDPIANDPDVVPDPPPTTEQLLDSGNISGALNTFTSGLAAQFSSLGIPVPVLIGAGVLALIVLMPTGNSGGKK